TLFRSQDLGGQLSGLRVSEGHDFALAGASATLGRLDGGVAALRLTRPPLAAWAALGRVRAAPGVPTGQHPGQQARSTTGTASPGSSPVPGGRGAAAVAEAGELAARTLAAGGAVSRHPSRGAPAGLVATGCGLLGQQPGGGPPVPGGAPMPGGGALLGGRGAVPGAGAMSGLPLAAGAEAPK